VEISKRSRSKFAEFATAFAVLRLIDQVFENEDFEPIDDY
jgi:Abortive infection C-terminus